MQFKRNARTLNKTRNYSNMNIVYGENRITFTKKPHLFSEQTEISLLRSGCMSVSLYTIAIRIRVCDHPQHPAKQQHAEHRREESSPLLESKDMHLNARDSSHLNVHQRVAVRTRVIRSRSKCYKFRPKILENNMRNFARNHDTIIRVIQHSFTNEYLWDLVGISWSFCQIN